MKVKVGGTRLLPAVGWGAQPAVGAQHPDRPASFPPPIQLHPVYAAQDRLALLVKLPFIRDGLAVRRLSGELTAGFGRGLYLPQNADKERHFPSSFSCVSKHLFLSRNPRKGWVKKCREKKCLRRK